MSAQIDHSDVSDCVFARGLIYGVLLAANLWVWTGVVLSLTGFFR